jgi:EmrB/QacA subfamily drug resistance transporter
MSEQAQSNGRLGWILGLTSTAYFMVALDALVVITALPRMGEDLHVGLSSLQWTVNSYGIAFAAGIISAAALGDRYGRRLVFTCGLALFTIASAACALAPDASTLIAARTVQGLGGAVVLPLSLTILTHAFPPERRGVIVGVYGGLAGLAVAIGPLLGAAVTEGVDWHWIFWINVPIGVVAALLSIRLLPESHGPDARLDLPGVALLTGGVVSLVWALTRANQVGWGSAETLLTIVAGAVLLLCFVVWERRAAAPMLPLRLLQVPAFTAGNLTSFLMSGAIFAAAFMTFQYFQFVRGYSPLATSLYLLPWLATPMVVAPIAGAVSDRIGRRPVITVGLLLQTIGFAWVALNVSHASTAAVVVALLIAGVGISMALPTVPTAVLNSVASTEIGKASGINYMMQRFGAVLAIAIAGAIFSAHGHLGSPAAFTDGFKPALAACAALSLLATVAAIGVIPNRRSTAHELRRSAPARPSLDS